MAKEILYRGKKIEELKQMDLREFTKLLKARARRAVLRQMQDIEKFLKKTDERTGKSKPMRTHSRHFVIVPQMVDQTIHVHNGKDFKPIQITIEMIGHRLGEFSLTRVPAKHTSMGVGATKGSKKVARK